MTGRIVLQLADDAVHAGDSLACDLRRLGCSVRRRRNELVIEGDLGLVQQIAVAVQAHGCEPAGITLTGEH